MNHAAGAVGRDRPWKADSLDDDAMQVGVDVQLGGVTAGVHEVDRELAHFGGRQVPAPGKHLRECEQHGTGAFVAADQCGEKACGDVSGLFALPVVTLGRE
jgi:hypothetical protein